MSTASLVACGGGATVGSGGVTPIGPTTSPVTGSTASPTASPAPGTSAAASPTPTPKPGTTASAGPSASASASAATASPTATASPIATASPTPTPAPTAAATMLPAGEKIYVVNHGQLGDNPSVTIYADAATGAAAPFATIAGGATQLAQPFFDVVDASGTLYVSNQSNTPGSQTAGYITEYSASHQSGNAAPTNTITGLHNPTGLAIDKAGNLYVAVVDAIDVFAPGATGNAFPIRVIGGTSTTLQNLFLGGQPYGLALDTAGDVFTTMGPVILEFGAGATGNVAPINIYGGVNGGNPATTGPPYGSATLSSCLSVAVDATGDVYCANFNNSSFALFVSPAAPGVTIQSTGASMPFGIFVDTAGQVYVANYKGSSVQIFSSMATFATGVATATISGTGTNLNYPYGVTAR